MIRIEIDEESWRRGFLDGKIGKRSEPKEIKDTLAYESGFVEGTAIKDKTQNWEEMKEMDINDEVSPTGPS